MSLNERKQAEAVTLAGLGVSPGVVVGPVYILSRELAAVREAAIKEGDVPQEIARLEAALIETRRQVRKIQSDIEGKAGASGAGILDAHLMVLDDSMFMGEVIKRIGQGLQNVESAVRDCAEQYAAVLDAVKDDYLRERVADIRDVARRVIRNLRGDTDVSFADLTRKHIIVAVDLEPSETAVLRKNTVLGFATDMGSVTSHTAVMARALEIPAVVGMRDISQRVATGDTVLIDGNKGTLIINPTERQLERYGRLAEERKSIERGFDDLRALPAETEDGHRIVLSANIEGPEEVESVLKYGAEGIGLFRSEFLCLARADTLSEDEQFDVYNEIAEKMAPDSVIIRTMDLGGDKYLPHARLMKEANPFLGCRSIRLGLRYPDLLKSQLRAILRASARKNVKIMYPMISRADEVVSANRLLYEAKQELDAKGIPFDPDVEVGAMIEIPSAALTASIVAEHVDFFSIGTNDLVQYTIAVDRVNENVAYLYEPTHPAVLQLIQMTVKAAHEAGIWVGVCGEMAADPMMVPLLLGLGVDELSVAPGAVPMVKDAVRAVSIVDARNLARLALDSVAGTDVLGHCRKLMARVAPEILELI